MRGGGGVYWVCPLLGQGIWFCRVSAPVAISCGALIENRGRRRRRRRGGGGGGQCAWSQSKNPSSHTCPLSLVREQTDLIISPRPPRSPRLHQDMNEHTLGCLGSFTRQAERTQECLTSQGEKSPPTWWWVREKQRGPPQPVSSLCYVGPLLFLSWTSFSFLFSLWH